MRQVISEDQIRAVYRETIDTLYGYVSRRCGADRALAEDVTQETWLRAVREWTRRGLPERPIAWLTTVARNLLHNEFRRRPSLPLESIGPREVLEAADIGQVTESA
jgi:DNA-directed RNA polymerase specialized sigma24 family protein